jgi:uncharacterized membrane protein HdeD (DUF308 family)
MTTSHAAPTPPSDSVPPPSDAVPSPRRPGSHGKPTEPIAASVAGIMLGAGAAIFLLGIMVLVWPRATLLVMAILFGCYLVVSGAVALIEGFVAQEKSGMTRVAYVLVGLLGIAIGLFCLRRIDMTVLLLAFLVGAFWIMRGIVDIAVGASPELVYGRGLRIFTGVVSILAGCMVLFWPAITLTILIAIVGAWLIFYGLMFSYMGFRLRHVAA